MHVQTYSKPAKVHSKLEPSHSANEESYRGNYCLFDQRDLIWVSFECYQLSGKDLHWCWWRSHHQSWFCLGIAVLSNHNLVYLCSIQQCSLRSSLLLSSLTLLLEIFGVIETRSAKTSCSLFDVDLEIDGAARMINVILMTRLWHQRHQSWL